MQKKNTSYDLIVAGGGTAGTSAAVAAARRGLRVLLVEEGNCLGGVSTASGVNEWYASLEGLGDIFDALCRMMTDAGVRSGRFFNGEYLKIAWQQLALDAGVEVLFHGSVVNARTDGKRILGLEVTACSQTLPLSASWVVDATGEGDLAAMAGAKFQQGHPQSGHTLHMSLPFTLAPSKRRIPPWLPPGVTPIESEEDLPGLHAANEAPDGRVYCNMTKVMSHQATDPVSLSEAEAQARIQLARIVHFLIRTRYPDHMLVASGSRIGIREGRRIVGDYCLTEADILRTDGRTGQFSDTVAVATCQIDFHSLTKPGHAGWRERVEPYGIPFRCLLPRGLDNLLVAGKCISGDQVAHSSYRMTPTCCAMGQAAGIAVALASAGGIGDLRQLDIARLQEELRSSGFELDPSRHQAFAPEVTPDPTRGA